MTSLAFCLALAGCRTGIDASALKNHEDERVRQMANTDNVQGPMERFLKAAGWSKSDKQPQLVNPPEAMAAYQHAEEVLKLKKYGEAEKAFWAVAKKYKNYPIREDAVFMTAESQFLNERYARAQDKYDVVIKDYPATRHMDEISRRKFEMARIWLGFPDIITANEVQPVNFEEPSATPPPQTNYREPSGISYVVPIIPNFLDKRRPLFDTQGRALEALKSIWLNDPTGPLADDALMLSASHYLRKGDYVEADHLYDLLRKEFRKSPHLENAFVLGAHAKLMSYQGPEYDGTELDEARILKESTLRLFPNRPDKARIQSELKKIEQAQAARIWSDVKYWKKKGRERGVANYCKEIIKKYPNTDYAHLAREELARIPAEAKQAPAQQPYEDSGKPGKASVGREPGAFDEPDAAPKRLPAASEDSIRS